ncbi:tryptophan halogenase family protein [Cellvibrio sp. pealriver]|uniref:tryptophan halogenase family protein n=1 Tax=Cellvibrio sp. pealriver TaxID=1622269 RepID=UPI00066FD7DE|nr:tryptophan halogenase family protein [Cellvibrio sp. pealriver]
MRAVNSIIIVGGGTAGWMTAASLKHHFKQRIDITLIESSEIGTIGVGEATIPTIRQFYRHLGLSDLDVIRATRATCKLGIQFNDWHKPGSSFIHPFGVYGQSLKGTDFHHYWLKLRKKNMASELGDYSLGVALAKHNKFTFPAINPPSSLSVFDWALHFDATLFAGLMRTHAEQNGVRRIDAKITHVQRRESDGFIESVQLDYGAHFSADLFIDCSGFKGLLIEETLQTGYEKWTDWLLCDRAFAVQSQSVDVPHSYTKVNARPAGWQWKIPLQHRDGNGHVFASQFMRDEIAREMLIKNVQGELLHEPRKIAFVPGRRKQAWNKNCIAIGLAAGFLEPLESTSIALVQTGIEKIRSLLAAAQYNDSILREFNETTLLEYERVRDFIILHYKLSARDDTEFWRYCRAMKIPDSLQHKMELFKASGHVVNYRWEMFGLPSWLAIFEGFNYLPDVYDAQVDLLDETMLAQNLEKMRESLGRVVDDTPHHHEFIAQHCAAPDFA